ncbi:putative aliphatic sulfonates transport permease protein SsuC [Anaerotignum neopropionicum]|uniref:Putative aliphatic sulfonates transport permease protein SsuC n=1 Tax=Anaerotignum neopropionicum TaxID=36847 RepID=A0A136WF41_9FIRM|nr:ABC transporter permease [Anaerotignum neopropionicum]KXL53100.1 putative aliphatic sulfonates transport permease protein SsuC [Anaerotignum neopropionicum]
MWYKKEIKSVSKEQTAFLNRLRKRKHAVHTIQWVLLVGFFLLWETAARFDWIDPFIFSQPTRMLNAGIQMGKDGSLWTHIGTTLWETVAGFVLGTLIGTLTAILLWWNRFVSNVAEPYLVVLNSLPKTALAPIIIVWLGNNQTSIIAVALLTSVIVTVMSVLNGFLQVDNEKIKLIQIFGGTKAQVLKKVVFPANIPCILNALKINVGLSFVGVIVGEFLVAQSGLGFLIVYGSQVFKLDWVMLSVIILAILAALMYQGIAFLEKKCLKWQQ